ncbi:hypothetical protein PSTG_15624 [Puccinia striiformis f. sp. tritici PST-78]|uniref:HAT C-terminal dimerisation domain-containing protein n=1 Tax=Puccinia striiformis f. sp. tritici PST-78 TaxID=1165861 RepID=A0A0L0UW21_9BASI|nr:hypothetical protein PSTG_15624 [Puccinia striiformis f. sp. tritici PST-78]
MEFGRKAIATEVDLLYIAHKDHLQARLKGMKYLSFTLDAWTSPNTKAFMAITVHGITRNWKMLDMLVGMPAVHGLPGEIRAQWLAKNKYPMKFTILDNEYPMNIHCQQSWLGWPHPSSYRVGPPDANPGAVPPSDSQTPGPLR